MSAPAGSAARPRVAVFVPVFGIPSEVWAVRQCLGFRRIDPVVVCWDRHASAPQDNYGLDVVQIETPWNPPRSLPGRIAWKLGWARPSLPFRKERREICDALAGIDPDVILCHFAWTGVRVGFAAGRQVPMVWHVHGRDVSVNLKYASYRAAVRAVLPSAAEVVAVGEFQLESLHRLGLPADKGRVIPCGAPVDEFSRRPIPERNRNSLRFISVGRLSPEKGVLETVEAFAWVNREYEDSELVVIGTGELLQPAAALAAELGIADRVRFAGQLTPEQIADELASAHVFLQHSRSHAGSMEGFGVTLTEAGASGLPLVVSRLGGMVDQVEDNTNGIFFEAGDVEGQAQAMLRLAGDEPLRQRLGEGARVLSARFDSVRQIRELEDLLLRLSGRDRRRRRS